MGNWHIANWHMANRPWRTRAYGEPTMANWHMAKRHHIATLISKQVPAWSHIPTPSDIKIVIFSNHHIPLVDHPHVGPNFDTSLSKIKACRSVNKPFRT